MKIKLLLLFVFLFTFSFGQIAKYSNEFLNIGASARAMAMGNAVVSSSYDGTSSYYNPANLTMLKSKNQINLLHSEYFASIAKYDFINYTHSIDDTNYISFSFIRLGIDNIQNTLFLYDANGNVNYNNISYFSVSDYALFISYAKKLYINGLSAGVNAKLIFRNQGEFANAYGFGLDLGLRYRYKRWLTGVMLKDITTTFTAWFFSLSDSVIAVFSSTGNEIPENSIEITLPSLKFSIARYFTFGKKNGLLVEQDLLFTFDGKRNAILSFNPISIYPQYGIEWNYNKRLFIRAGMNNFQWTAKFVKDTTLYKPHQVTISPNIGLGIQVGRFQIDYALTNIANAGIGMYSHVFSLKVIFDKNYRNIYRSFSYY